MGFEDWACNRCSKKFFQKNNWIDHMEKSHGVKI